MILDTLNFVVCVQVLGARSVNSLVQYQDSRDQISLTSSMFKFRKNVLYSFANNNPNIFCRFLAGYNVLATPLLMSPIYDF